MPSNLLRIIVSGLLAGKMQTAQGAIMVSAKGTLQGIRNNVLNTALIIFALACIPTLAASLARVANLGWQPIMTLQVVIVLLLAGFALFRHRISFHIRAAVLLGSLALLGISGVWSFGLISGSLYFYFIITVLATLLYGSRLGWIILSVVILATLANAVAVVKGVIHYDFDMNAYATNPSSWATIIIGLCLILGTTIAFLGSFHAALMQLIRSSNQRAENLAREIAERQAAEQAKKDSEDKFRRIVENIKDIYFESTLDGTLCYCSPSCLDLSGYHQDELIGRNIGMLYNDTDDRKLLLETLYNEGTVRDMELTFKKKSGETYDASVNADFSFDKDGKPTLVSGTLRDITASKKFKQQKHRANKMEVVGLMAGGVAHDLNNILSGIIGYPELLLQKIPQESELRNPLEQIHDSGRRAALVVDDLLTVARGVASNRKPYQLNELVQKYRDSPECTKLRATYHKVAITHQLFAAPTTILCSPIHVQKCLMNLVMNAAEAIPGSGAITISTANRRVDSTLAAHNTMPAGEYVVLSVQDTGPGIPTADLEHIFEPFYTKKIMGRSGTGLGLAVVWNTMEDHEGKIIVESKKNGTRFDLYFPACTEGGQPSEKKTAADFKGHGEHILVVDDEQQLREIAVEMLQSLGYQADAVDSGEQALAFVRDCPVDLLVLDMLMEPGMNGRKTYEEILQLYPRQKAIIASGFSEGSDVMATLKLGAHAFLKKPYVINQLGQAVQNALTAL